MIDHFTLKVRDYGQAKAFYTAALKPIGYAAMMEFGEMGGFGAGKPDLWIARDPDNVRPMHFALHARDRAAVDAFYEAAIAAGGKDNGKPGVRTDYHPTYYAAFVFDPDGHNVEVVCHAPPRGARAEAKGGGASRTARRSGGKGGAAKRGAAKRGAAKRGGGKARRGRR